MERYKRKYNINSSFLNIVEHMHAYVHICMDSYISIHMCMYTFAYIMHTLQINVYIYIYLLYHPVFSTERAKKQRHPRSNKHI